MLRIMAVTDRGQVLTDLPVQNLTAPDIRWYWVDFDQPDEREASLLADHFRFHPLAIEDCFHFLQRPKLDHYDDVQFFVLHAINQATLNPEEVDLFLGPNYVVSFHLLPSRELDESWRRMTEGQYATDKTHLNVAHLIIDKLVDGYFPSLFQIEDALGEIEANDRKQVKRMNVEKVMDDVFDIRSSLLKLRRTVIPMRDLLYRMINTDKIEGLKDHLAYFTDIYDHLLKLSEMIESNREMTADMRDSYISLSTNRMNTIMKTLTVITTIFMPLTFIAGIYGMNFSNMPELTWRWGYFIILGVMAIVGISMFAWFWRKRWFE